MVPRTPSGIMMEAVCAAETLCQPKQECFCRLQADMARAAAEGWRIGLKTVRGAYMHTEASHARSLGRGSPVHATIQDTHSCYNRCIAIPSSHLCARHRCSSHADQDDRA